MKKTTVKKLQLGKSTITRLNPTSQQQVLGGATRKSVCYTFCGSIGIACTVIDCTAQ